MTLINVLICVAIFGKFCSAYYINPGPSVIATKGEVWPKPFDQQKSDKYMILRTDVFKFSVIKESCKILDKAVDAYLKIINSTIIPHKAVKHEFKNKIQKSQEDCCCFTKDKSLKDDPNFIGYLDNLDVELSNPCGPNDVPDADMDEEYILNISMPVQLKGTLQANSIWGILRGLETFSQLLYLSDDASTIRINTTSITDKPRYHHRGLLLDTSRHFIPLPNILQLINAMVYNKMNVFHWHIVDDQSFPYESKAFPDLSAKGAYTPEMVYSTDDVQTVIKFAARRGIRVLVEFDTPGHTRSWGLALPELLTECFNSSEPNGYLGPINPIKNETYTFLQAFFAEVAQVFPEKYVHLGGDEVGFECWASNPDILKWMEDHGMKGNFSQLEEYYVQQVVDIVTQLNANSIVWEEVFGNGVQLPKSTVVHIWNNNDILPKAVKGGFRTLWSTCWYLDHLSTGGDWTKYYDCDPHVQFDLPPDEDKLIIGGEACMWTEVVDLSNVVSRTWPRASAVAEKLWSPLQNSTDINEVTRRLEEHACRMKARGILVQPPNGPGFCR